MESNTLYKKITDWLLPLGYVEVFANHPLATIREFHFSKDGVRVICTTLGGSDFCWFSKDIVQHPFNLTLKSGRFAIGTEDLEEIHNYMKNASIKKTKPEVSIYGVPMKDTCFLGTKCGISGLGCKNPDCPHI